MRISSIALGVALVSGALAGAGCGDDTTSGAGDMSIVHDLSTSGAAPTCAAYCAKIQMNCVADGDAGSNVQYPDSATCQTYCATGAGWAVGMIGDTAGNTIGCRLYHAGAAAADPVTHCPHAGPTGGDVCGSYCDNYCQLMARNCTGANAVYDAATCMTDCAMIPTSGHANDQSGNTIQCRIAQLGAAQADPANHCGNARYMGDPMFSGPCH
ncbi:MAG TPA: hypothetical protein VGH63_08685 [Polyangia bacterium]